MNTDLHSISIWRRVRLATAAIDAAWDAANAQERAVLRDNDAAEWFKLEAAIVGAFGLTPKDYYEISSEQYIFDNDG